MIHEDLTNLERKYNIKILFSVETGSRLWRIESKNSDYDIRFIYKRPLPDYLLIHPLKDVIDYNNEDRDYSGWDIFKFIRLLINSNPSIIEWIYSDMIYTDYKNTKNILKEFISDNFNPVALYYHYRSMCKSNYISYIHSDREVTYKKYLYTMRGLINAKYVEQHNSIPPLIFTETLEKVDIPLSIKNKVYEIIQIKKHGDEKDHISHLNEFEYYIEDFLKTNPVIESRKMYNICSLQSLIYDKILDE